MSRPSAPDGKEARLAAALRDNLRRRKAPAPPPQPHLSDAPDVDTEEAPPVRR